MFCNLEFAISAEAVKTEDPLVGLAVGMVSRGGQRYYCTEYQFWSSET